MIVLLPKDVDGLQKLEGELSSDSLAAWAGALRKCMVRVFLPRFETTRRSVLNGALAAMGMVDAFSSAKANFAGMDGRSNWLFVSAVVHKAFVRVNEEGTQAAAATDVIFKGMEGPSSPWPDFRADHPFLFLIQEKQTGSILFLGRLCNPTEAGE